MSGTKTNGVGAGLARNGTRPREAGTPGALFEEIEVGALRLPHRIVMAPMTRNRAGEGNAPRELNEPDPDTFYGGGAKGYVDYPALGEGVATKEVP